jgi:hypothetical protein
MLGVGVSLADEPRVFDASGSGERALMRAVLEDAIRCLGGAGGPSRLRPTLAAEARRWVTEGDRHWPYSFENICDALGLDADHVRARLLERSAEVELSDAAPAARTRREPPPEHAIVSMIREGHPLRVVAETFGISVSKASILSCSLASRMKAERDEQIRQLRSLGWTHRALAKRFQLSRIRVMRICAGRARRAPEPRRSAAA